MKKLLSLLMIALMLFAWSSPVLAEEQNETAFNAAADHAIAVEATTGKILYEKDATTAAGIASITKILTVYMVYKEIQKGSLTWDTNVDISDYAYDLTANSDASNVPMEKRKYTVKQLVDAALVASANSAAIALAEKIGGTESKFVDMMSDQLKKWGITDAKLVNASGLNNSYLGDNIYPGSSSSDENMMSALDVAIVAQHLINDFPEVLDITKQTEMDFDGTAMNTWNYMLENQSYSREGVDGLKTGTTELAGASFVAHSKENGMSIITVILHADNGDTDDYARFSATNDLLNYVVQNWEIKTAVKKGETINKSSASIIDGKAKTVPAVAQSNLKIVQKIGTKNDSQIKVSTKEITAPVTTGTQVGTATYNDPDLIGTGYLENAPSVKLTAGKSVQKSSFLKVWWNHFVNFINEKL
ncbi:D-alanyl-D-alanine carboxypeptidase PBP3 [Streptococcus dentiloxodontae]